MKSNDDNIIPVGKLITSPQRRDAIHIAVLPAIANGKLKPGDRIGLVSQDQSDPYAPPTLGKADGEKLKAIAIVDPYLEDGVSKGDVFYAFMLPYTIQSLSHHWTHKDLPAPAFVQAGTAPNAEWIAAVGWMEGYADSTKVVYDDLMRASTAVATDPKAAASKRTAYPPEFWKNFEIVVGKPLGQAFWKDIAEVYGDRITTTFTDDGGTVAPPAPAADPASDGGEDEKEKSKSKSKKK